MSVTSVNQLAEQRGGLKTNDGREYFRTYLVTTNSAATSEATVINATGIPAIGTAHPDDAGSFVVGIEPSPVDEGRLVWHVRVRYRTRDRITRVQVADNPLNEPPVVTWSDYAVQYVLEKDRNDAAIVSSAGEPFDPPIQDEKYYPMVTIERYASSYSPSTAFSYYNTTNNAQTTIAGFTVNAGQALLKRFTGQNVYINNQQYWRVQYQVMFAPNWDKEILDRGFYYLETGNYTRIKDADNKPVVQPRLLDGSGGVLGDEESPVYLVFSIKGQSNFSGLGLNI